MVPLIEYWPLVLVPPPPETLNQSMEYCCARAEIQRAKATNIENETRRFISLLHSLCYSRVVPACPAALSTRRFRCGLPRAFDSGPGSPPVPRLLHQCC